MTDNVGVPPFPSLLTRTRAMYDYLQQLRDWVFEEVEAIRYESELPPEAGEKLELPEALPELPAWEMLPINDQFVVLMTVRRIREVWDSILREHEDAWNSKAAVRKRYYVVMSTLHVLKDTFVSPEVREAQAETAARKMRLMNKKLSRMLTEIANDVEEEADDADADAESGGFNGSW